MRGRSRTLFSKAVGISLCFLLLVNTSAEKGKLKKSASPLSLPAVFPGDSLKKVESLLGPTEFEGSPVQGLSSHFWHKREPFLFALVDGNGTVVEVTFQFKSKPFVTDDGVIVGRDTIRAAAQKLGKNVLARSRVGYVVDASCFGYSIRSNTKGSKDWTAHYEALECDEGNMSIVKLPQSPISNVTISFKTNPKPLEGR